MFIRGERKAASTLRGILSGKALSTKHHLSRNPTATETLVVLICSNLLARKQSQRLLQTSWVLTKKKILFLFALNRGNPKDAGILTNFYKEFIYVYCIFRAGLYKDGMNGISVVLSISLHDFSGRQQLLIRGSVP